MANKTARDAENASKPAEDSGKVVPFKDGQLHLTREEMLAFQNIQTRLALMQSQAEKLKLEEKLWKMEVSARLGVPLPDTFQVDPGTGAISTAS